MTNNGKRKAPAYLSRRGLVLSAGVAAACRPFLRPLRALAAGTPGPKRVFFVLKFMGVNDQTWFPTPGPFTGAASLPPSLSPLGPYYNRLLLVDGVDNKTALNDYKTRQIPPHSVEVLHVWTGIKALNAQPGQSFTESGFGTWGYSSGQSLDQHLAQLPSVRGTAPLASLDLGLLCEFGPFVARRMSFAAPGKAVTPRCDPKKVFDSLFGSMMPGANPGAVDRARLLRTSILSQVRGELGTLRTKLAPSDRPTLDGQVSAVDALEKSLARRETPLATGACPSPSLGAYVDPKRGGPNYPILADQMLRIMATAFACDLTRVGTFFMDPGSSSQTWVPGVTMTQDYHHIAHMHSGEAVSRPNLTALDKWYSGRYKFFLDLLGQLDPGGALGLLDNTMMVHATEHRTGQHNWDRIPFFILNGLGHFKTGQSVKFASAQPHNNFLVSVAQAMGSPITKWGDPAYSAGPLPGLV